VGKVCSGLWARVQSKGWGQPSPAQVVAGVPEKRMVLEAPVGLCWQGGCMRLRRAPRFGLGRYAVKLRGCVRGPSGLQLLANGLELSCPAEAGRHPLIVAHASGPDAPHYPAARRVSFSELLGSVKSLQYRTSTARNRTFMIACSSSRKCSQIAGTDETSWAPRLRSPYAAATSHCSRESFVPSGSNRE
jgi:hypothetical protein